MRSITNRFSSRVGLSAVVREHLMDSRMGRSTQLPLVDLFLLCYEDCQRMRSGCPMLGF